MSAPILVFDSGVGGLTVLAEIHKLLPDVSTIFAADTAAFPYGRLTDDALKERVMAVMERLIGDIAPALVVIACNTASTLILKPLRARFAVPFVGTVPAIKPAAAQTKSGLISVLATPGTVSREYTAELIRDFAADKCVTLVGSRALAALVEAALRGERVKDEAIAAEIAPAFVEQDGKRTDAIVLACTHYPLLTPTFERLAPWPVIWIDPAPAIARRVRDVLAASAIDTGAPIHRALVTSNGATVRALAAVLSRFGLGVPDIVTVPGA
ncbi:MAG: glutamate racemase [Alphaproteobacteria bacterium]